MFLVLILLLVAALAFAGAWRLNSRWINSGSRRDRIVGLILAVLVDLSVGSAVAVVVVRYFC